MGRIEAQVGLHLGVTLKSAFAVLAALLICSGFGHAQTLPAGSAIRVKLEQSVTTESAKVGDAVVTRVSDALKDRATVVMPAGSRMRGRIDYVSRKSQSDDGWMRLVFDEFVLPDGQLVRTQASGSFRLEKPNRWREHVLAIGAGATVVAVASGRNHRMAGFLGGAIAGLVFAQNRHSGGRDLKLGAGKTITLRLTEDLIAPLSTKTGDE
jgi:hypothetical protein